MTIQTEPDSADHMFAAAYPANNFNGTGEGGFLKNFLGPRMRADHPDVRSMCTTARSFMTCPSCRV